MTFAFGHLIGAWIPGKIYEKITNVKLHNYTWLFFLILAPLLVYLFCKYLNKTYHSHAKEFTLALATGILMHLILDMATSYNGIPLFWPNLTHLSFYHIG